jgi:hypothetical protein
MFDLFKTYRNRLVLLVIYISFFYQLSGKIVEKKITYFEMHPTDKIFVNSKFSVGSP